MKREKAFSLVELVIGLIIITIVVAAFAPVALKRAQVKKASVASRATDNCPEFGFNNGVPVCSMCYLDNKSGGKKCIICNRYCKRDEMLNEITCECENSGTNPEDVRDVY